MAMLKRGSKGSDVKGVQSRLLDIGFSPGKIDGIFGRATEIAVINFQRSQKLLTDGIFGPRTVELLFKSRDLIVKPKPVPKNIKLSPDDVISRVTVGLVSKLFSKSSRVKKNIEKFLPSVLKALKEQGLTDRHMVLMALATIKAESAGFEPISEFKSKWNTSPGGEPYGLYDFRTDIGNGKKGDGAKYKGRGFIQLTGKHNYTVYSKKLNMGPELVKNPDRANEPLVAARVLALFLKDKEMRIKDALIRKSYKEARKAVNGGTHGIDVFRGTIIKGLELLS
jgi:peptidoglycan L-alanyl-D-glutamate endopeptidase CwlK